MIDNFWLQLGEGEPRPTYPLRLRVGNIEAERERIERELGVECTPVVLIPGLVALCNFRDPWGNNLGFYQVIVEGRMPRIPGGSFRNEHKNPTRDLDLLLF